MADDGYLIGFEDSSGNFVEVGRFNNLSGNTSDPVFIEHSGSGTRIELDGSGFNMNRNNIADAGSVNTEQSDITNQESSYAYLTANQSLTAGSLTQIEFDATRFDNQSEWNLTNNEWTANRDGIYLISVNVRFAAPSVGDQIEVRSLLGGSASAGVRYDKTAPTADEQTIGWTAIANIAAGESIVFEARNKASNDTLTSGQERTNASIHKIA